MRIKSNPGIEAIIAEYRSWVKDQTCASCRLVQYTGIDLVGCLDVSLPEVESQLAGLLAEGWHVAWSARDGRVVLKVWENPGPEPEWQLVYQEKPLGDVGKVLRDAGF